MLTSRPRAQSPPRRPPRATRSGSRRGPAAPSRPALARASRGRRPGQSRQEEGAGPGAAAPAGRAAAGFQCAYTRRPRQPRRVAWRDSRAGEEVRSPHACAPEPCSTDLAGTVTSNYRDGGPGRPRGAAVFLRITGTARVQPSPSLPGSGLAWSWGPGGRRGVGDGGQGQGSQSLELLGEAPFRGGWGGAEAQEWPLGRVQLREDHSGRGEESKLVQWTRRFGPQASHPGSSCPASCTSSYRICLSGREPRGSPPPVPPFLGPATSGPRWSTMARSVLPVRGSSR